VNAGWGVPPWRARGLGLLGMTGARGLQWSVRQGLAQVGRGKMTAGQPR
jgi:hypothetical protein